MYSVPPRAIAQPSALCTHMFRVCKSAYQTLRVSPITIIVCVCDSNTTLSRACAVHVLNIFSTKITHEMYADEVCVYTAFQNYFILHEMYADI